MRVLICGDIVGKAGRNAIRRELPSLKKKKKLDFVLVNGENAANGFGITKKICEEFYSIGVDVITSGNHIWDQKEIVEHIETDDRLIRPCNFSEGTPGKGYAIFEMKNGSSRGLPGVFVLNNIWFLCVLKSIWWVFDRFS